MQAENGMRAGQLTLGRWRKSSASNPSGSRVEIAELPDGKIAVPQLTGQGRPALVWHRQNWRDFSAE